MITDDDVKQILDALPRTQERTIHTSIDLDMNLTTFWTVALVMFWLLSIFCMAKYLIWG